MKIFIAFSSYNLTDSVYKTPSSLKSVTKSDYVYDIPTAAFDKVVKYLRATLDKESCVARANWHRERADALSAKWSNVAKQEFKKLYGRTPVVGDYKVSGVASEEFSEPVKNQLRTLTSTKQAHSTLAAMLFRAVKRNSK